jgi:DNA-binding transcriptional regulator YdaS (Cro superfamily)
VVNYKIKIYISKEKFYYTTTQINEGIMELQKIVNYFGSKQKLAETIGTSKQNVNIWKDKGYIPTKWAVEIEKATNGEIKRAEIRPDIFT